ncbi:hypothetical protein SPFM10_00077 [Salmonella phage SPFM10]|nr:hypothetical protein SPFM10_00077 [Salmonella phage SPFM10]
MKSSPPAKKYQAASRPVGSQEAEAAVPPVELKPVTPPAPLNPTCLGSRPPYDGTKSPTGTGTLKEKSDHGEVENNKLYDRLFYHTLVSVQSRTQYLEISYKELVIVALIAFSAFVSYAYIVQWEAFKPGEGEKVTRAGKIVTLSEVSMIASVFKLLPFLQMLAIINQSRYLNKAL